VAAFEHDDGLWLGRTAPLMAIIAQLLTLPTRWRRA
jgi:hypothetical protein